MKDQINRVLREYETCNFNNRKTTVGFDFVVTRRELEKVALDLMNIGGGNKYDLEDIEYFTKELWG